MKIIKRDGSEVIFNPKKIENAITKANEEVNEGARLLPSFIKAIAEEITMEVEKDFISTPTVEDIQDIVVRKLARYGAVELAMKYQDYRIKRELARKANTTDDAILSLIDLSNEELKQENSNKNPIVNSTQRDYMAGEVSKDISERILLPENVVAAHKAGEIHFHDQDYFVQKMYNCCLINLEDMLQNGTVITNTMIEKPHSFDTACNVTTQIVAQVASNQYGGQTFTLAHLAPFVDISRQNYRKEVAKELAEEGFAATQEQINAIAEKRVLKEIKAGVQKIQYQILTLMTTNGQTPFVSVFMYDKEVPEGQTREDLQLIIKEVLRQRIQGVKNEKGVWTTPAFPKLLYVLDDLNTNPEHPYYQTRLLAAQCTAKRMVPDYISEKKMLEEKGDVFGCMGCRSWLTRDRFSETQGNMSNAKNFKEGKNKYWGRFNQGVVTINLVDVACSSDGDMDRFWGLLEERLELCHTALRCRHERLLGTVSDVAPIIWQYGAIARLEKGETIDKLLYNGYSTISLGYAGLYEMTVRMLGVSHTTEEGKKFALSVMQALNDACEKWKKEENIDYSVYGTPLESTTYKFSKCLQKKFGIIKDVTDHNYITNSYHVNVRENIDAFTKLGLESEFQHLSQGGAISYVEVPNLQNNIDAVIALTDFIYNNIMYAELNTKSDYCMECGYNGEIVIVDDDGKLVWECPNCHCRDEKKLSVVRRTCGYLGTNFWNQGRTQEIKDRVLHL